MGKAEGLTGVPGSLALVAVITSVVVGAISLVSSMMGAVRGHGTISCALGTTCSRSMTVIAVVKNCNVHCFTQQSS